MPSTSRPNPEKAAKGGRDSIAEIFKAEEPPLIRYAFSLTGRRAVAEEVVQDVFLQLHRHWETVENPRAWLYRSVRNRSYNHNRHHKREVLTDEMEHHTDDGKGEAEAPDSALHRMEAAGFLRLLLEELEEADRDIVKLKYFEDLKYAEISERTGLSIGNVGYRLHHILKRLADKLRKLGIESTP